MKTLKHIISNKRFHVGVEASIKEAMGVMHSNKNGCAVILEKNKPVSIITESDIVLGLEKEIDLNSKAVTLFKKSVITANENLPIDFAFDILGKNSIRRVVLVNNNKEYAGVVLQEDLFDYLEEDVYKVDLKISDIMKTNPYILRVDVSKSTKDALRLMQRNKIGSIIVTKDDMLEGIITEKDILNLTFFEDNLNESITKHMTSPVVTVNSMELVTDVISKMKLNNIRRIVIIDEYGYPSGVLTNRDIIKHIRGNYTRILQNKIKHAQEIMDFLPEPIVEVYHFNHEDLIYGMNYQAKKVFGEDILDSNITRIIDKDMWKEIKKHLYEVSFIKDISLKIGEHVYEISATMSKNINTNYIKIIFKDVTVYEEEKNKLQSLVEEEIRKRIDSEYLLMQQSKLATMGEMIGHIAHQWRQPLAQLGGIFMNLESAYEFNELDHKYLQNKVDHGNEIIKYMSKTIEDFRYFFEPTIILEKFNLYKYLQNAINIIEASLTYNHIRLDMTMVDREIEIWGYPSEFSQVILNLLANSKDALIQNDTEDPFIKISTKTTHDKIIVEFQDNGGGIDDEVMDNIFDIYFTTKSKKEGSGLGLYMSKLIIENKLEGEMSVRNTPMGALFSIELPKK